MKKLTYMLLGAALAMSSCSESILDEQPDQAITFQVANYMSTKADPTNLDGNPDFSATAYFHESAWASATEYSTYMNGVTISHQSSPDCWAPASTYYWPKTGLLSFWGYSPSTGVSATYDKSTGITFWDFTVVTDPSSTIASGNKVNLMYSDEDESKDLTEGAAMGRTETYGHSGVPMIFHHALAKLKFNIVYKEVYYNAATRAETSLNSAQKAFFTGAKVKSLKIYNLSYKGSFQSSTGTWTPTTDRLVYADAKTLNSTETAIPDAPTSQDAGAAVTYVDDYFVLPQSITGATGDDTNIEIEYYILPQSSSTPQTVKAKLSLKTSTLTAWTMNNIYEYTLVLTPVGQPILFDPKVVDWNTVTATSITVVP